MRSREAEAEIKAVTAQINMLMDDLARTAAAIDAVLSGRAGVGNPRTED